MDIKDLIKKADAYGQESQIKQQQIEEGLWDDLVGKIADVAKGLGIPPETADKVANAISTQPEAKATTDAAEKQGIDGPTDAAAAASASDATAPTAASGTGVSPDAAGETQDLMTRYNAGGKKAMPEIEKLQQDLKDLGFDPNGVDGKYGNGTFKAVQEFQKANGLQADGQAGKDTLAKIEQVKAGGGDAKAQGQAGATAATAGQAQPDEATQAIINQLDDLMKLAAGEGGTPQTIATSADQDLISSMRGTINIVEASQLQIRKLGDLLNQLGGTEWAKNNAAEYQKYVDRVNQVISNKPAGDMAQRSTPQQSGGAAGEFDSTPNATTAAAAGRADAADAGQANAGVDGAADATASAVQGGDATTPTNVSAKAPAAPKVGKEVYVQMGANGPGTANFNVSKMKAKYPKPYVDIPAQDGTVTRGYGAPETLQAYVKKNPQAKIVGAGGQPQVASKQFDQDAIQEGATMNVSADNAAELAQLLGILKNAGMPDAMPVSHMHQPEPQGPMPCATCGGDHDADSPCGGGEDWDNSPDEGYGDMMDIIKLSGGPNSNKAPGDIRVKDPRQNDEEVEEDGWDNSPEEEYKDDDYMYQSGGIHKKKKAYAKAQDGDNAMAVESIKSQLYKALEEKLQSK
jgi:peptidoglycan hydrolase-like protein with peptidoglycan-binding domain